MDHSTPGFSVYHQLPKLSQIHVIRVGDAIQPSHPLSSPSPPTFNLAQHQGLFKWVNSLDQVAKVLEFKLQRRSFQWIFRTDFLYDGLVGSPCCPRDSQESSPTPQFNSTNSFFFFFKLYNIVLVLPNIEMDPPQVYLCSPSWTLLPPPSPYPYWVFPVHQPQASSIVHRTWTGISFHTWYYTCFNASLPNLPTLSLSHRVHKTDLYISVSFAVSYTGLLLPSF